jgi:predicted transporter
MKKSNLKGLLALAMVLSATVASAQGAATITQATSDIQEYIEPVGLLIQGVGAIVGIVGGIRIYNKWNNGDNDVNKELIGWGGACVFLLLVPTFVTAFFGL